MSQVTKKTKPEDVMVELIPLPVPPISNRSIFYKIKCFFVFVLMYFTAYFGTIFMQCTVLPIAFIFPAMFKRSIDYGIYLWFKLVEFLLVNFLNVHVRHFGDDFLPNGPGQKANFLLMLNHRTRLDWMYTWLLGEQLQSTKIVLKAVLGAIPGAGWAMNFASFIFLERKLNSDSARIKQATTYLSKLSDKVEIFIFPEGTDLDKHALERNRVYALKVGKPITRYTLHPRVNGTLLLLNELVPNGTLQYIYDVTVAYPFEFPTHEPHVFYGRMPREVHFYVRRYDIRDLPLDKDENGKIFAGEACRQWLEDLWLKKEFILEKYYSKPAEIRKFEGTEYPLRNSTYNWDTKKISFESQLVFLYWLILITSALYLICTNNLVLYFFIFCNVLCMYIWATRRSGIAAWIAGIAGYPIEMFDEDSKLDETNPRKSL